MEPLTLEQFGAKIKEKYPAYSQYSDKEIGQRMITKYPEYKSRVFVPTAQQPFYPTKRTEEEQKRRIADARADEAAAKREEEKAKSTKGFLGNFGKAFVRNIAHGATSLGDTLAGIANSGKNQERFLQSEERLTSEQQRLLKLIREKKAKGEDTSKLEQIYKDNVRLLAQTKADRLDTTAGARKSNAQVLGEIGETALDIFAAGTYGKATTAMRPGVLNTARPSILPNQSQKFFSKATGKEILGGGALGYGYDVSLGLQSGEEAPLAPGVGTALGLAIPILGRAGPATTKTLRTGAQSVTDPNKIMQRVARISKQKQANFEQRAGESIGEYLVNRGIYGDIDEISTQLYQRFNQSKNAADEALASLQGEFQATPVKTALEELVARETRVSAPGVPSPDLARVKQLLTKHNKQGLNMSEINEVKRLYERNVRLDFVRQNLPEGVARATNIDNAMREWQFAKADELGLKNLPEINNETSLAKQLLDDIGKEYAGSAGNNAISLTDWIILAGGDPTAVSAFLTKKVFGSKGIQSSIARKLAPEPTVPPPSAQMGPSRIPLLPAPRAGSPASQVDVPINLNSRPQSQIDAAERANPNIRPTSFNEGAIPTKLVGKQATDSLIQEARKYKSAEEFVKAQGNPVFRGGDTAIDVSRGGGRGISVSNKETAELFTPPKGGVVDEAMLPKTAKILKENQIPKELQNAYIVEAEKLANPNNFSITLQKSVIEKQQAIVEYARKNGFDAVEFPFEKEIRIVKPNILKTKSQLTDIWEKATGNPIDPQTNMLRDPEEGIVYYHGTRAEDKRSILKHGVDSSRSRKEYKEQPGAFYIASREEAGMYGKSTDLVGVRVRKGEKVKTLSSASQEWADVVGKSRSAKDTAEALEELRKRGYDAVNYGDEIEVLNPTKFEYFDPNAANDKMENLFGGVAGIETDEEGNLSFDPAKAGLGVLGMGALRNKVVQQTVSHLPKRLEGIKERVLQEDFTKIKGIAPEKIKKIRIFGSSVEGKKKPNDIDVFVTVSDDAYKWKKTGGIAQPLTFDRGKFSYIVMPESDAQDLLDAMLYTGRKDPDRAYSGTAVTLPKKVWGKGASDSVFGGIAGLEVDEEGNVSFDVEKALIGTLAIGSLSSNQNKIRVLQETRKQIIKRVAETSNKMTKGQLMKAVRAIDAKIRTLEG